MKKLRMLLFAIALGMFTTAAYATVTEAGSNNAVSIEQEVTKTPVEVADLPEAVSEALKGEDVAGWEIAEAALISDAENSLYSVKLVKGEETKIVKITAEGEIK